MRADERLRRVHVHLERPQIPIVHADDLRAGVERRSPARRRCAPRRARRGRARPPVRPACFSSAGVSAATISSTRVGAGRPRLEQLILGDDEVLAQQRDVDGRAHRTQMLERAVEERRLGQHRNRRGAGGGVARWRSPTGSYSARSTPRDGDRRLHSAMTFTRPRRASAAANSAAASVRPRRRVRPARASCASDSRSLRPRRSAVSRRRSWRGGRRQRGVAPLSGEFFRGRDRRRADPASAARRHDRSRARPIRIPSSTDAAAPAMNSAAPAFSSTTSRAGAALAAEHRVDDPRVVVRVAALERLRRAPSAGRRRRDGDRRCSPTPSRHSDIFV